MPPASVRDYALWPRRFAAKNTQLALNKCMSFIRGAQQFSSPFAVSRGVEGPGSIVETCGDAGNGYESAER